MNSRAIANYEIHVVNKMKIDLAFIRENLL